MHLRSRSKRFVVWCAAYWTLECATEQLAGNVLHQRHRQVRVRTIFASTTFIMTVAASLSFGVIAGYAVTTVVLKISRRNPAAAPKPTLVTAAHASGD